LAVTFLCAYFPAGSAAKAELSRLSGVDWQRRAETVELMVTLENWLDRESRYPRRSHPVSVQLINADRAARMIAQPNLSGRSPRGFYEAENTTIYLVEPWSPDSEYDAGVLLHELVHHRQQTAGHWYCSGAQELPAYRLQDKWLAERGLKARINWIAVVLESGCASRDIHPD
jgi:hypothetical protein